MESLSHEPQAVTRGESPMPTDNGRLRSASVSPASLVRSLAAGINPTALLPMPRDTALLRSLSGTSRSSLNRSYHLRALVKCTLSKRGDRPDKQERVTFTVFEQTEVLFGRWASG